MELLTVSFTKDQKEQLAVWNGAFRKEPHGGRTWTDSWTVSSLWVGAKVKAEGCDGEQGGCAPRWLGTNAMEEWEIQLSSDNGHTRDLTGSGEVLYFINKDKQRHFRNSPGKGTIWGHTEGALTLLVLTQNEVWGKADSGKVENHSDTERLSGTSREKHSFAFLSYYFWHWGSPRVHLAKLVSQKQLYVKAK